MAVILPILWLIGTLTSAFFIIRPRPDFPPFASRKRAAGMLALVFFGLPVLAGVTGALDDDKDASQPAVAASTSSEEKPTAEAAAAPASQWVVSEETSPLDDSHNVYAAIDADNEIKGWLGSERPTLTLRCKERKLEAYLDTKSQIASNIDFDSGQQLASVKYRIGKGSLVSGDFPLSSDGKAIFIRNPKVFVSGLSKATSLVVEYTPFQAGMGTATFDITGAGEVAAKVLGACKQG